MYELPITYGLERAKSFIEKGYSNLHQAVDGNGRPVSALSNDAVGWDTFRAIDRAYHDIKMENPPHTWSDFSMRSAIRYAGDELSKKHNWHSLHGLPQQQQQKIVIALFNYAIAMLKEEKAIEMLDDADKAFRLAIDNQ